MAMLARTSRRGCACLLSLLALGGCGGGSVSPDAPAGPGATPMAVSPTVTPAGATMVAALAGGGQATLIFPAGAVATDTRVTVTPATPAADEWTRFTITPGVGAFARSVTVRVRPPTEVSAAQVPIMQIAGADGMRPLRTRALGGEYVVELHPQLAAPVGGLVRPAGLVRRADGHEGGTTLAGTGFVLVCQTPEAALADAQRVIDNASGAAAVLAALSAIAMLEERCAGRGLDEATLLRVTQALREFGARIPQLYRNALAAWQAVDYLDAEIQLETFRRGVRRLLALCAAARTGRGTGLPGHGRLRAAVRGAGVRVRQRRRRARGDRRPAAAVRPTRRPARGGRAVRHDRGTRCLAPRAGAHRRPADGP